MLAALGFAGGAAGIHQEQRVFGIHTFRFHPGAIVFFQLVIDEKVASIDHGGLGGVFAGIALPDQHFVDLLTVFFRMLDGDVRVLLVV